MSGTQLRIWHIVNIPGPAFRMPVNSPEEAMLVLDALADFDNFVGDDKPWTTVGGRANKMKELSRRLPPHLRGGFNKYTDYLLIRCPGGVPIVATNVCGLETFEDGEWIEWYNDDGDDIGDMMRARTP